jgi:hypothetical protein
MKTADKVGTFAFGTLAAALAPLLLPWRISNRFEPYDSLLQWLTLAILIYAGMRRSRWWLLLPVLYIALFIWAINQGV